MLNKFTLKISALCIVLIMSFINQAFAGTEKDICLKIPRDQIAPPAIFISSITRAGNPLSPRYRIKGSYEGACLGEVGVFEDGKRIQKLRTITQREFKRYDFSTSANIYKTPEIRAYTVHGDRATAQVKPKDLRPNFDFTEVEIYIAPQATPITLPVSKVVPK